MYGLLPGSGRHRVNNRRCGGSAKGRPPLWISSERSRGRRAWGTVDGVSSVLRWLSRGRDRLEAVFKGVSLPCSRSWGRKREGTARARERVCRPFVVPFPFIRPLLLSRGGRQRRRSGGGRLTPCARSWRSPPPRLGCRSALGGGGSSDPRRGEGAHVSGGGNVG